MVNRHPDASLLAEYACGSLSPAMCAAITTHLHFCKECRSHHKALDDLGGSILEHAEPVAMSASALDKVLACLEEKTTEAAAPVSRVHDDEVDSLPANIQRLIPLEGPGWRAVTPSLKATTLPVGEQRFELGMQKICAGGTVPEHDHRGMEVTVVLKGSFSDEDGIYQEGDFIVREPGDVHRPFATQDAECICLSVVEAPIRMTGMRSLINPFLSFNPA